MTNPDYYEKLKAIAIDLEPKPLDDFVAAIMAHFHEILIGTGPITIANETEYNEFMLMLSQRLEAYFSSQEALSVDDKVVIGKGSLFTVEDAYERIQDVMFVAEGAQIRATVAGPVVIERLGDDAVSLVQKIHNSVALTSDDLTKMFSVALDLHDGMILGDNGVQQLLPDTSQISVPLHQPEVRLHKVN